MEHGPWEEGGDLGRMRGIAKHRHHVGPRTLDMDAVDCIGRVPFTLLADLRLARFGGLDAAELQMMRAQDLKQAQGVAKVKLSLETEEEPPTDGSDMLAREARHCHSNRGQNRVARYCHEDHDPDRAAAAIHHSRRARARGSGRSG